MIREGKKTGTHPRFADRSSQENKTMRDLRLAVLVPAVLLALHAAPAMAYIGPGAGITMLSALWGVIVAIALAIGAVLFWPIRALLRRRRKNGAVAATGVQDEGH